MFATKEGKSVFGIALGFAWVPLLFSLSLCFWGNTTQSKDGGFRILERNTVYCIHTESGRVHGFELLERGGVVKLGDREVKGDLLKLSLFTLVAETLTTAFVVFLVVGLWREKEMPLWLGSIPILPALLLLAGDVYLVVILTR